MTAVLDSSDISAHALFRRMHECNVLSESSSVYVALPTAAKSRDFGWKSSKTSAMWRRGFRKCMSSVAANMPSKNTGR